MVANLKSIEANSNIYNTPTVFIIILIVHKNKRNILKTKTINETILK